MRVNESLSPFENKHVLIARDKKKQNPFQRLSKSWGGVPVEIPLLGFRPRKITPDIQDKMKHLSTYDWVIFTSNVTVETFLSYVELPSPDFRELQRLERKQQNHLKKKGLSVEFIPTEYVAEAFVDEFTPLVQKGMEVC